MTPLRHAARALIAMLGMVAVVLAALEHESLLLQGDPVPSSVAPAPSSDSTPLSVSSAATAVAILPGPTTGSIAEHLTHADGDTGTEGTFRSETQVFWTAPTGDFLVLWRLPEFTTTLACTAVPLHLGQHARARIAGVRALRV